MARPGGLFRTNRQLRVTRPGKYFILMTVALGLGVLNSGNNLLYLCLGLLLSMITVSGILSELNLRDLDLRVEPTTLVVAGDTGFVDIHLHSIAKRTVFSLSVRAVLDYVSDVERREEADAPMRDAAASVLMLEPGERVTLRLPVQQTERGEYHISEVHVGTEFPFGLFEKTRLFQTDAVLLVAPQPVAPAASPASAVHANGALSQPKAGSGYDLFELRDAERGEDFRNIAWRKSAATGRLVAVRRAVDSADAVLLGISGDAGHDDFERALQHACALVLERQKLGLPTGLFVADGYVALGCGEAHERDVLRLLARTVGGKADVPRGVPQRVPIAWVQS